MDNDNLDYDPGQEISPMPLIYEPAKRNVNADDYYFNAVEKKKLYKVKDKIQIRPTRIKKSNSDEFIKALSEAAAKKIETKEESDKIENSTFVYSEVRAGNVSRKSILIDCKKLLEEGVSVNEIKQKINKDEKWIQSIQIIIKHTPVEVFELLCENKITRTTAIQFTYCKLTGQQIKEQILNLEKEIGKI